jgi:transposase
MKKCFNQLSLSRDSQGGQSMLDRMLKDVTLAILMEYEQRVIIRFLFNEGVDARQIADRLRAQFHENADALRTVQFWIAELRRGREDLHNEPRRGRPLAENLPTKIQELLHENPFESARSMAETPQVSHSTVLKHLHEDLQFQSFHLRWVPHLLTRN